MDEIMFYYYIKYRREQEGSLREKIKKEPVLKRAAFMLALIAIFGGAAILVLIFTTKKVIVWLLLSVEIALCFAFYIFTEKYLVRSSADRKKKFNDKCKEVQKWLRQNDFKSKDKIQLLHKRLVERISHIETDCKNKRERRDRWMQILVIPLMLTIIPLAVVNRTELSEIFAIIITVLICFGGVYAFVSISLFTDKVLYTSRLEKMKDFADILQDILDWIQIEGKDENNDKIHAKTRK